MEVNELELKTQLAIKVFEKLHTSVGFQRESLEKVVDETVRVTNGIFKGIKDDKDYIPHHKN